MLNTHLYSGGGGEGGGERTMRGEGRDHVRSIRGFHKGNAMLSNPGITLKL